MSNTTEQSNKPAITNPGINSGINVGSQVGPIVVKPVDVSPGVDADQTVMPNQPSVRGENNDNEGA
jgi:hypothetical protein